MTCTLNAVRRLIFAALVAVAPAAAAADKITVDDLLNAEDLDATWNASVFSPDGRALAYTVTVGAATRPTWGYNGTAGLQIMSRVFVTVDGGAAREIVGPAGTVYSVYIPAPWSPDSKGLLLVATHGDTHGFAHYDVASGKLTPILGRLVLPFNTSVAWLPDGRFVFATLASETPQIVAIGQVLQLMSDRWRATWDGRTPQLTVHSTSPVFEATPYKPGALMLADPRAGTATKIADGDFASAAASPAGDTIAAVATAEGADDAFSRFGRRSELVLLALGPNGARVVSRQTDLDVAPDQLAWSPSGKTLLVAGKARGAKGTQADLYALDARSGKRRKIASEGLSFSKPSPLVGAYPLAWSGETPVAIGVRAAQGAPGAAMDVQLGGPTFEYGQSGNTRADIYVFGSKGPQNLSAFAKSEPRDFLITERGDVLIVADGALWKLKPGAAEQRLTSAGGAPVIAFGVDAARKPTPAARTAYYAKDGVELVGVTTLADGKLKRLNLDLKTGALVPVDVAGEIAVTAPNRRTVLIKSVDGWSSSFAIDDGARRELVTVNAKLKGKAVAPVEKFTYVVGKRTLNGWVVWPPDAKKSEKLPAIVFAYGGTVYGDQPPAHAKPETNPVFSGQLLAADGYAVIYPSTPMGPGSEGDQPAMIADAAVAAVDALVAGGRIDTARVGVMGQSFGGFSTASVLARRSDRFKAGVALAGLYDYFHAWGARPSLFVFSDEPITGTFADAVELAQGQFGKPFWQVPDAYIRNSPIFQVEKINAPLLMLHGDFDLGATDLQGAERLYTAMLRSGKTAALVHYWGEGHVAMSAAAMRDQSMRIKKWFAHYVKGAR